MKKFFVGLLTLCLCLFGFTACEETPPSTPEPPPAETPQPEEETPPAEEETEEVEEPERTVTTEFSLSVGNPCLLITEYLGNQVQSETYYDTRSSLERHFKYDYDEQGSLKSFEWITLEHFYALSPNDPDYDGLFVELTQGENGKFTGTQDNVDVEIEVHENGTIKKRALLFDNQYEDAYTVGAEFDEQGRRISDYYREEDNSLGIICQYAHEGNELFSRTCSVTEISTMSETPIGPSGEGETQVIRREKTIECSIGRGENNLLTSVYINEEEINVDFEYASNGRLISSATTYYNDSIIMEKNTVTFSYYDTGFVSQVVEKEYGENNRLEYEYIYTYDEQGLRTGFQQLTYDANGNVITPEPQTTVTTEFSLLDYTPFLLTAEYYGNQLQKETYVSPFDGFGICFEYGYNEQGVLETFAYDEMSHFYISQSEGSEHILFTLEQSENGVFTSAYSNVRIQIEVYENGIIKKRELSFGSPNNDDYDTLGSQFDEQGRRISNYHTYAGNSLIGQYTYEGESVYSNSCTITQIADNEEISFDVVTTRENNLLTSVYIEAAEVAFSFEYATNGSLMQSETTYYDGQIITGKNTINYVYNEAGFVSQVVEKEYGENNQLQCEYAHTYNEQGLKTHYESTRYNYDGSVKDKSTSAYEYDNSGEIIKSAHNTYEYTSNTLILTQSQIVEYNDTGRVSSTTYYNTDGSYYTKVEEYENRDGSIFGNLVKETKIYYDSNNTLYKDVVREFIHVPYDQGGWSVLTTKETTTNYNTDGSVKNYNVIENEYNDKNKCIKITTTQYVANNVVEYKNVQEYTYDENGSEIKHKLTKYGANCVLQSITEFEYVIHANTRYTVKETDKKYSNGILSETRIQTWEYHDNWKSEHHTIHETFYLSDGNIDEEEITEYIYNDGQTDRLMKVIRTDIEYDYTEEYYYKRVYKREENSKQECLQSTQTDYRANGTIIDQHDYKYNEDGTIDVFTFVSYDENETIKEYSRKEHSYQFDNEGSLIKDICHEYDINNSLIAEFIYGYDNDKVITFVETYFASEGVIDHKYEYEYEYTNTGERLEVKQISTFYTAEGEVDYVIIENYEYDDNNKKCKIVEQYYNGTTLEYIRVQEGTTIYIEEHHAHFFFESKETYTAYNPDGSIEYQTEYTYTYDDNWNCLSTTFIKYDANGNIIEEGSL